MSDQTTVSVPRRKPTPFRGSLARTLVLQFILVALIPAAIIATASYIRYQTTIKNSFSTQLSTFSAYYAQQIDQMVATNGAIANNVNNENSINFYLASDQFGILASNDETAKNIVNEYLTKLSANPSVTESTEVSIVSTDTGYVYASSNSDRIGTSIVSDQSSMKSIMNTNQTALLYNPSGLFKNNLVLVTTLKMTGIGKGLPSLSIVVFTTSTNLNSMLTTPTKTYNTANAYFLTSDNGIASVSSVSGTMVDAKVSDSEKARIRSYAKNSGTGQEFTYKSYTRVDVISYIKPLSATNAYYVIEVPQYLETSPLESFRNYVLLILGIAFILAALIAAIFGRSISQPLVQLSGKARQFAGGDFTQRVNVNRRDEIGMLGFSFNYMVDQLSEFYQSLESKVAERTKQIQLANEIGQEAISSTRRSEILRKVVQAIVEKFSVPYAAIFTADQIRKTLTLTENFGNLTVEMPQNGMQIPLDNNSLVGWVANNDQSRISQDIANETLRLKEGLHFIGAQSEICVPIKIGDQLYGVLNIQSDTLNGFDVESVPTFNTLADQIANGLKNIELLETTQINLQGTAVLYNASSKIAQSPDESSIYEQISTIFADTNFASFLLDIEGSNAVIKYIADSKSSPSDKSLIDITIPFADALQLLRTESPQIVTNFQILSEFSQLTPYFGRRGCSSIANIPVYEGQELKHVLVIGSREDTPITSQRVQPYEVFADILGVALERFHLSKQLEISHNEFSTINSVARISTENLNVLDLCSDIHAKVREQMGDNIGFCVAINDEDHGRLKIPYFNDHEQVTIDEYDYSNDLVSGLIRSKENQIISDAAVTNIYGIDSPSFQRPVRSWAGFPLLIGGSTIGAVAFFDPENANAFSESHLKVFALLAAQMTLAISNNLVQNRLSETMNLFENEKFLLDSLLENIEDRIVFKGKNNEFIRVSKSMAKFLGLQDPRDLIGKKDDYNYVLENRESELNVDAEIISSQIPVLNKFETWVTRSGVNESMLSNKLPLMNRQGELYGLLTISTDITEQKKVEQLAKHRADQLQTASEIARESTAGSLDVQVTLAKLVDLIRSRFGFYHASIFLIDPLGKNAVLRESTGEAGAQMKNAGHKLAVGSSSIVGQATGKGTPVVVGDVTREENYFANPLLPDTRSELAIPLKIADRVLGALDVQSKEIDAFTQEDINILQVLADQIAVAIQNADLYTHTDQSLSRYRMLHQITAGNVQNLTIDDAIHNAIEILHQSIPAAKITYFGIDENNLLLARASAGYPNPEMTTRRVQFGQGVIGTVAQNHKPIRVDDAQSDHSYRPLGFDTNSILAVPVIFADTILGVINIESTDLAFFDEADQEFVTTLADNIASIISNIRLLDQVREQIDRQQKLFEVTNKIRRSIDIETIMQTSVSEICTALKISRASIHIAPTVLEENKQEKES
jgi:PAS domain S-box-containing protein